MTKIKEMSERKSKLIETPLANNPHPKDLSKSPAVAGFFVCGMMGRFEYG